MARDITKLHPRLQEKIAKLKKLCAEANLELGIGECLRTVEEQDALYAQGRTTAGSIVTNAKGSAYESQHQWGVAFDFFKNIKGSEFNDTSFFYKVGALAKSLGLGWGGDWKSFVDLPHLYLTDWGGSTSELKKAYGTPENFFQTWENTENITVEKNIDELAAEVISGKWGNGNARKENLTKAGYDYTAVQKRVNDILAEKTEQEQEFHIVQSGDTLATIAKTYNTTINTLIELNEIKTPDLIFPNQKIRIR